MSDQHILFLTTTYPTFTDGDWTPAFVHELAKRVSAWSKKVVILTPRRPESKSYEYIDGVHVHRYPYFFSARFERLADSAIMPNLKKNPWMILQVPSLIISCFWHCGVLLWKYNISLIHAHWLFINWFIACLFKLFKKNLKVITTVHGSDLHTLWIFFTLVKKRVVYKSDRVTLVSHYLYKYLQKLLWKERPVEIVSMWVDEELFHHDGDIWTLREQYGCTWPVMLFVWRLAPEKWVDRILGLMPDLCAHIPDVKLLIVWDGPSLQALQTQVDTLWIQDAVEFIWAVSYKDLPQYYRLADLFISWSYKESFGLVAVEALLCNTPVVAPKWLWIDEIVVHWQTWYFYTTQQEALESCLAVLQQTTTYQTYRESVIEKYWWWSVTRVFLRLYDTV